MKVSVDLETAAVRQHPDYPGVYVKVRSIFNERSRTWRNQALNRVRGSRNKHGDNVEAAAMGEREAAAGALEGWGPSVKEGSEPVEDGNGPIEFSPDAARKLSREPAWWPFFDGVRLLAEEEGKEEELAREESLGNSAKRSTGGRASAS